MKNNIMSGEDMTESILYINRTIKVLVDLVEDINNDIGKLAAAGMISTNAGTALQDKVQKLEARLDAFVKDTIDDIDAWSECLVTHDARISQLEQTVRALVEGRAH